MSKRMKRAAILLFVAIMAASMFLLFLLKDSRFGLKRTFSKSCFYEGKEYKNGDGFKASDGCNSCSCGDNGQVACTLMYCE